MVLIDFVRSVFIESAKLKVNISQRELNVRPGPKANISHRYLITPSVISRNSRVIVRPSSFCCFSSSNRLGYCTDDFDKFAPSHCHPPKLALQESYLVLGLVTRKIWPQ